MRTRRERRRSGAEISRLRDGLYEIVQDNKPCTVRQVFYLAVSAGLVAKTEAAYKTTVCRLLVQMRRDGELPFAWVVDNTRWIRKPVSHDSMADALQKTLETYRRALWVNQDVYLEVWCEKDAISGVLAEETRNWDVPLMVTRGFSSITFLHSAAQTIQRVRKPTFLYYFGDHDPSGVRIDPAIERGVREFAPRADITFRRVAVVPEQIEDWGLPTRPTKRRGNAHAKDFQGRSVEVDAIPPATLRDLVRECIERHIDPYALEMCQRTERRERAELEELLGQGSLKEGLEGKGSRESSSRNRRRSKPS